MITYYITGTIINFISPLPANSPAAPTPAPKPKGNVDQLFGGMGIDFNVFGGDFHNKWISILSGVWTLSLGLCIIAGIFGVVKWLWSRAVTHSEFGVTEGSAWCKRALAGFACLAMVQLIFRAIWTLAVK